MGLYSFINTPHPSRVAGSFIGQLWSFDSADPAPEKGSPD
jgi:hypothetical protein